jgi:16S rRNA (guanine527-N7)-methyltransferase
MEKARIAELLRPFLTSDLSDRQLGSISMYIDILARWNQRMNLTAVRQPEDIVTRHFGESLFAAQHLFATDAVASTVVDVGSGAGFPGLPIKIWAPTIRLTLIESNHKKATFLKEVVRALGLEEVEVFAGRAEDFTVFTADVVTLRAVERFADILPIAAGLVKTEGRLALLIGSSQIEQAKIVNTDIEWQAPVQVPLSNNRLLLCGTSKAIRK